MSLVAALLARLHALVTAREDARPVAVVRMTIGLAALLRVVDGARILDRLLAPTTLRLPYVSWAPAPTPALIAGLVVLWVVTAACFAVGRWTRAAGAALVGVLIVVISLDEQTYSNHLYLLAVVVTLLVLADAGRALSLDARRAAARPAQTAGATTVPAWPLWLLKVQVSVVYGFAALAKMNPEYASGVTLGYFVPIEAGLDLLGATAVVTLLVVASLGSIVVELVLAIWLWIPRRRATAFALGGALHVGMIVSLTGGVRLQLVIFAVEMWAIYLLFAPSAQLAAAARALAGWVPGWIPRPAGRAVPTRTPPP